MARPKKDVFEDLDPNFKAAIEAATDDEIKKKISTAAIYRAEQEELFKNDADVLQAKEALGLASQDYKAAISEAKLQIKYATYILNGRRAS